jgi:hypothetical protein
MILSKLNGIAARIAIAIVLAIILVLALGTAFAGLLRRRSRSYQALRLWFRCHQSKAEPGDGG